MSKQLDYYHFLISPWSYMAISRFNELKQRENLEARYKPINVMQTLDNVGSPTYKLGDEFFWGQDRIDFLERAIQA